MKPLIGSWGDPKDGQLLINLSGGIDSVYCLYETLKRGHKVVVHHTQLQNKEHRHVMERQAVLNVMGWLQVKGLKNFTYHETLSGFGSVPRVRDVNVWAWWMAIIVRKFPNIHQVMVSTYRVDSPEFHDKIIDGMLQLIANRELKMLFPLAALKKASVVRELIPRDLLALCWYCRRPKNGAKCGKCHSCVEVNKALKGVK